MQSLPVSFYGLEGYIKQSANADVKCRGRAGADLSVTVAERSGSGATLDYVFTCVSWCILRGYVSYGLPLGDLIQEGNVGLMKAVERFDPLTAERDDWEAQTSRQLGAALGQLDSHSRAVMQRRWSNKDAARVNGRSDIKAALKQRATTDAQQVAIKFRRQ